MRKVKAISKDNISDFENQLTSIHPKYRILFDIGIQTGLRVSDILNLQAGQIKKSFEVVEKKTKKRREIRLSDDFLKQIRKYIKLFGLKKGEYLVFSASHLRSKPLSRVQAYRTIKKVSEGLKIDDIGAHSMRKSYARELFYSTGDITVVQKALNHDHVTTTILYLFDNLNELKSIKN